MPRRRRYTQSKARWTGRDFALRHIEEGRRLSTELGGTDRDVKDYFFQLGESDLTSLLEEYEARYGSSAREYAEKTFPRWRSGQVQMGGQTAERLFALLPPRMPLREKYRLTEGLWKHVGPSSSQTVRVGLDAELSSVLAVVQQRVTSVVTEYRIPPSMEQRFDWLAAGDVQVKQDLLNRLLRSEEALVLDGVRTQFPVMIGHLRSEEGAQTQHLSQTVSIGKHVFKLLLDPAATGVHIEDGIRSPHQPSRSESGSNSLAWLWWAVPAAIILLAVLQQGE